MRDDAAVKAIGHWLLAIGCFKKALLIFLVAGSYFNNL